MPQTKPNTTPISQQILKAVKREAKKISAASSPQSLLILPKKISFETQESKEEIIIIIRRHLITNLKWISTLILMSIIPLFISEFPAYAILPPKFQFMTIVIWYILTLIMALENFLSWYFNVNIITDERIIDVDFHSLIYKRISEAKLDQIQDVTYSQGGFIESIFNYGTINIQTAANVPELEFEKVPQPAAVTKIINQLILQEEQEKHEGRVR
jgi:hypothetical protein